MHKNIFYSPKKHNSMYCHNYINGCIKFAINAVASQQKEKILLELCPANTYDTGTIVFTLSGKNASLCCTLCLMHMRHTIQDSSLAMHDLLASDHLGHMARMKREVQPQIPNSRKPINFVCSSYLRCSSIMRSLQMADQNNIRVRSGR